MQKQSQTGKSFPYGVSHIGNLTNFSIALRHARSVTLCLFTYNMQDENAADYAQISLDHQKNRTGHVWHIALSDLPKGLLYGWKIEYANKKRGDQEHIILDPYATSVVAGGSWCSPKSLYKGAEHFYTPLAQVDPQPEFDWQNDTPPNIKTKDLIIYETHIRGFTQHPSSGVAHPGSYRGFIEKIPYLVELGINAVELMPMQEFNETEYLQCLVQTKECLPNYWGYSSVNFFAPMSRYASTKMPGAAIGEFKTLVRELHKHGIEVILDVVFNHTAEGNQFGPVLSFKALDEQVWYIIDENGNYQNYTGCGNTVNCNHPIVRPFILSCLRYWVDEMHVDGFRFDLASILTRDVDGRPLEKPPLIDMITSDPVLASTKLIAEPWDAAGLYQLGNFPPKLGRWSEWNGKYRDTARSYLKGAAWVKGEFAGRITGSQDLFGYRGFPYNSINFITCHDGFTLADLVSYDRKHNLANGEHNMDGTNENYSWNCGVEGATDDPQITSLRDKQRKNFVFTLMISQGVPLFLMGDEYGHTKNGNNNTWCHDNELNWFRWDLLEKQAGFHRFCRKLFQLRNSCEVFRHGTFLTSKDVIWHGEQPNQPVWDNIDCLLAFSLRNIYDNKRYFIAFNPGPKDRQLTLPSSTGFGKWRQFINTNAPSPQDFYEEDEAPEITSEQYLLNAWSAILLRAESS